MIDDPVALPLGGLLKRLAIASLLICSCTTHSPVGGIFTLEKDTGAQCTKHCGDLGMRMSAVVIISSMTGCVCEPRENKTTQSGGAAAVTSGAVAAIMAAQQQQQHQQQAPH
jgi:hypothetical protein